MVNKIKAAGFLLSVMLFLLIAPLMQLRPMKADMTRHS